MTFIDNMPTLFLSSGVCVWYLSGVWVISPLLLAFTLKSKYIISFTERLFKLPVHILEWKFYHHNKTWVVTFIVFVPL